MRYGLGTTGFPLFADDTVLLALWSQDVCDLAGMRVRDQPGVIVHER